MKNLKHSRFKSASLVVVVVALVYGANYVITPALVGERLELCFRPRFSVKFDPETWKRTGPTSWKPGAPHYGVRCEMVDDLLATEQVFGKGEEGLISMLGEPDLSENKGGEKRLFYVLGDQRTYPARSVWFPGYFANLDRWMLEIRLRDAKAYSAKIFFD